MNILVCFDNNDCLVTRINCYIQEAEEHYLYADFTHLDTLTNTEKTHKAMFVLDTEKPFKRKYKGNITEEWYIFDSLELGEFVGNSDYINIKSLTTGEVITVEPQWFYANDNRIIIQD